MSLNNRHPEEPYWWRDSPPAVMAQQEVQPNCDVVIVGAGYTGLTSALILATAGCSVQVFDSANPGYGASTRNGGITSGNLRLNATAALKQLGETRAKAVFAESVNARTYLRNLIEEHNIDCDYQLTGRFTGAMTHRDLESMARESEVFARLSGIEPAVIKQAELSNYVGSETYVGGIYREDIGHLHPAKFHAGLLKAVMQRGGVVHANTPITKIIQTTDTKRLLHKSQTVTLRSSRGDVSAAHVLIATNGYSGSFNPWINRRIVPVRSRIVVTEKLSRNLISTLIPGLRAMGENRNLYRYYRPTPDGERLLFGSREPAFYRSHAQAVEHVRQGMAGVFPELKDVAVSSSWAGNVAFSRSHLPLLFNHEGIYYAMGYCGSGTVWAPWFGRKVAESILDEINGPGIERKKAGMSSNAPKIQSALAGQPPAAVPFYRGNPWFLPAAILWNGLQDKRHGRLDKA